MSDMVAKDFKTLRRRFKANDDISEEDIPEDTSVLSYAQLKERGFIVEKNSSLIFPMASVLKSEVAWSTIDGDSIYKSPLDETLEMPTLPRRPGSFRN